MFSECSDELRNFLDYDAIGRWLSCDYVETTIAGERLVYRCE